MKQRHRSFIAIKLPEDIKKKLVDYQGNWPELSSAIRWTKKDNIHITLAFLGSLNNEELVKVCEVTKDVASRHSSFFVNLSKICYGPIDKMPPRMIWAVGEKSEEFASLRDNLNKSFTTSEKREFSPHITLGRIRQFEWRQIEPEERPIVEEEINLNFSVNSIEIMESQLKRGGPEYIVLESCNLKLET